MENLLKDRVALVTGASTGIGRATAISFGEKGAKVVISDIDEKQAKETLNLLENKGTEGYFIKCDVSNPSDVQNMINNIVDRYGRLDFACNNAGIGGAIAPVAEYEDADWNKVISVNLTGVFYCMKNELKQMLKQSKENGERGVIVNMSSILGKVGFRNSAAYVSAKHGLIGLTETAALEYATEGIRINAVCPGFVETPMIDKAGITRGSAMYAQIASLHAMNRLGKPEEIAGVVTWLCSNEASFITGHALVIDGGYIIQ